MIGKHMRHLNRYKDIVIAFSRNGLGYVIKDLGLNDLHILPKKTMLKKEKQGAERKTLGIRIRRILEELGPTFIKLGQVMSTRPDLFPEDVIFELEKLQSHVPHFPYSQVKTIIEEELDQALFNVFDVFDETPLAAASIGQVHRAVLLTGEEVAVKIQRPEISKKIDIDFDILMEMAQLAEMRLDWAKRYQLKEIVEELKETLKMELDYTIEAHHMSRIKAQFRRDADIYIPDAYHYYTTKRVLVMDYVSGEKLKDIIASDTNDAVKKRLAEQIVDATFKQVLIDGFFHADPHPGNIMCLDDGRLVLLDFGMVGQLSPEMKQSFSELVIAMTKEDTKQMVAVLLDMGMAPDDINKKALTNDVDRLMMKYYRQSLKEISLADAIRELFQIAYKHKIELSSDFTLLGKTILTLEGTIEQLDPTLSLVEMAKPFGEKLLHERFRPDHLMDRMVDQWLDWYGLWRDLPEQLKQLRAIVKKGKIHLDISLPDINLVLKKLDRVSNQLSFAIILLAFSIIMVGLIVGSALTGETTILWRLPVIEIGSFVAIGMFIWLIYAIFKSGRF
ncbi:ABC1 kinase family protein [Halolactibacillus halophilus]|uniref:ABC transporter n=2 Tax=Halolactibacillus halophilus TaxID=306540 RepID=A0ABQ0VMW4_9BACI|nr:AarF/ABC1/UbiB kinase family protein [Halolactibacillus halophilus]GEM02459.1 ABC transporter [Halolactibacillus halophilus]